VVSLANNHANDFGAEGLADTVAALAEAGIAPTGTPGANAVREVDGTRVAVVGFAPYPWADPLLDVAAASARVAEAAARADVVVVTMHAGAEGADAARTPRGPETYLGEDRGDVRAFARAVIDAGADLVVGHGPHVLRGIEFHAGRPIAYSLGNLAGYGTFSLRGPLRRGAVLQVELGADGAFRAGRLVPTRLVGKGAPAPGGDGIAAVRRLSRADFGGAAARIDRAGVIRPPDGRADEPAAVSAR
jgi:poly-gamma-glutamate capsule biosynthesis protein CapA/YwtB (metallophosphatase superfamily)